MIAVQECGLTYRDRRYFLEDGTDAFDQSPSNALSHGGQQKQPSKHKTGNADKVKGNATTQNQTDRVQAQTAGYDDGGAGRELLFSLSSAADSMHPSQRASKGPEKKKSDMTFRTP
jgi:hypothetical protein